MPDNNAGAAASATGESASREDVRSVVSRVLSLSIFFLGAGLFSAVGLVMYRIGVFSEYQVTYFAVGVAVGVVGILLWLVAR